MTKKNEVAVVENDKPAYLQAMEQQGSTALADNFDASDIVIPQVKLLQGLSKECEAFERARPGRFWHTGMDEDLGEHVDFIVCSRRKKYLLIAPQEDGKGVLARADDFVTWDRTGEWSIKLRGVRNPVTWRIEDRNVERSGLARWGTMNPDDPEGPPAATLFYDYLVLLPDYPDFGPSVISLARSAIKKAKKGLNDKIALHAQAGRPMQSVIFRASPVDDRNPDGQEFKNWSFTGNGWAPEPLFHRAKELEGLLQTYRVQDEAESAAEPSVPKGAESKDF